MSEHLIPQCFNI